MIILPEAGAQVETYNFYKFIHVNLLPQKSGDIFWRIG